MISVGIIATGLMVLVQQLSVSFREADQNDRRAFAYQKAAALLGELQSAIALGYITNGDELLALCDAEPNVVLTTRIDDEGLTFAPDHPMSGNLTRDSHWLWSRQVSVVPHEHSGLYYCRVEVDHRGDDGEWHFGASNAQLFSLLPATDSPEQIHDVYVLACANAPSTWTDLTDLRLHVENAARKLMGSSQARLRVHWISRMGYGRDPCYAPYVNDTQLADQAAPWAYWLPGALGADQQGSVLYRSEMLDSLHRTELGLADNPTAQTLPPVTLADRNNHCMRTPAAWRLFNSRVAAGLENEREPPLQLLLDDMRQRPERYRNALFLNLHGSALPAPPLRNFSDAAKDPLAHPGIRAVTHPSRLWTARDPDGDGSNADTRDVELRVYAYRTEGHSVTCPTITVRIYGADLTSAINSGSDATLFVHRLQGGIDTTSGQATGMGRDYVAFDASGGTAPTSAGQPHEMWFQSGYVGGADNHTWIRLRNTPVVAPPVGTRGMDPSTRLCGSDYVPAAVDGTFQQDLATDSIGTLARNTARWRIRIPATVFDDGLLTNDDQLIRVVTQIGSNALAGQRWPTPIEPLNRSETWTWWANDKNAVPVTEQSQFLGDPRLCPYEDVTSSPQAAFPHGYNWHFSDLQTASSNTQALWPGLDAGRLRDGFANQSLVDAPRFLQLYRNALQACGNALINPTHASVADVLLLGGEIAHAAQNSIDGIQLHGAYTGGSLNRVNTVVPGPDSGTLVLQRGTQADWWAQPWLGELFPDDMAATWFANGNLPMQSGSAPLQWRLLATSNLPNLAAGVDFTSTTGARIGPGGLATFVNHGNTNSTVGLTTFAPSEMASAQPPLLDINDAANLSPPGTMEAAGTWSLTTSLAGHGVTLPPTDSYPRSFADLLEAHWTSVTGDSGSVLRFAKDATQAAFLVAWNTTPQSPANGEICLQALLAGIRTLHLGGDPSRLDRVEQLPLLELLNPGPGSSTNEPDLITVRWRTQWLRFDGQPYLSESGTTFTEDESELVYRILWSMDDGETWTSALTGLHDVLDEYPEQQHELLNDMGRGTESYTFALPGAIQEGDVLIAVEAWRKGTQSHTASHRARLFVRRTP